MGDKNREHNSRADRADYYHLIPGIPDEEFIRGDIPMTREEIRAVVLSRLMLAKDHDFCDIGAGTGSVTVEAAIKAPAGSIYAVEKRAEGMDLIAENLKKFGCDNAKLIAGEAPEALADLPRFDRVFIGGSGGRLPEILDFLEGGLKPGGRAVINAITMNTLTSAWRELRKRDYKTEIIQVSCTRTKNVKDYDMFDSSIPVFIITARDGGEEM